MLPECYGGWRDEANHFLSPQKTGLEEIRKSIIFIVQLLHDLVNDVARHILGYESPDEMDRGMGRL
jgi:hypothetical protein